MTLKNHDDAQQEAQNLCQEGMDQLNRGHILKAINKFNQSLAIQATAEGYTYRGWAISFLGMLDQAIDDCRQAIQIDPNFGNPYNDIGVYLMNLGENDKGVPWLEKAKQAKRYEPRHFPYLNLGRIYLEKGDQMKALDEYIQALDIDPENKVALKAIAGMKLSIN